jgi:phosphoglycerol transferase MdoB-like AlkP superfamily enzyme
MGLMKTIGIVALIGIVCGAVCSLLHVGNSVLMAIIGLSVIVIILGVVVGVFPKFKGHVGRHGIYVYEEGQGLTGLSLLGIGLILFLFAFWVAIWTTAFDMIFWGLEPGQVYQK